MFAVQMNRNELSERDEFDRKSESDRRYKSPRTTFSAEGDDAFSIKAEASTSTQKSPSVGRT